VITATIVGRAGYAVPVASRYGRLFDGEKIPVKGASFPQGVAPTFEPQGPTVLDALPRIEGGNGTSQHLGGDAQPPRARQQLQVHAGSRPERAGPLDEGPAGAQIDERHRIAGPENRLCARDHRLAEARVGSTVG
jgi:hypothetical protein